MSIHNRSSVYNNSNQRHILFSDLGMSSKLAWVVPFKKSQPTNSHLFLCRYVELEQRMWQQKTEDDQYSLVHYLLLNPGFPLPLPRVLFFRPKDLIPRFFITSFDDWSLCPLSARKVTCRPPAWNLFLTFQLPLLFDPLFSAIEMRFSSGKECSLASETLLRKASAWTSSFTS